ncbi:MAG: cytochrome c oxidase assembly protein [Candidatus Thiodiazotropha sp.]
MNPQGDNRQTRRNRRTTLLLGGVVVLMFGFGFAMVPLYSLFCEVTGTQSLSQRAEIGRAEIGRAVEPVDEQVETDRWVTVKFDTTVHPDLPWAFEARTHSLRVHPGATYKVHFSARNRSHQPVTGQAIPSIAPWQATPYFSKLECFCFNRQTLEGSQEADMPLRFQVSSALPEDVHSLTLSYTFMRLKGAQPGPNPPGSVVLTESS